MAASARSRRVTSQAPSTSTHATGSVARSRASAGCGSASSSSSVTRRGLLAGLLLERPPHRGAGPVQENALVTLAELEQRTHLLRRPALDVAQHDHPALHRRQELDRRRHGVESLAAEQVLLRKLVPTRGRAGPVAAPAVVVLVEEPSRVD